MIPTSASNPVYLRPVIMGLHQDELFTSDAATGAPLTSAAKCQSSPREFD